MLVKSLLTVALLSVALTSFADQAACESGCAADQLACLRQANANEPERPKEPVKPSNNCGTKPAMPDQSAGMSNDEFRELMLTYIHNMEKYAACIVAFEARFNAYLDEKDGYEAKRLAYEAAMRAWEAIRNQKESACNTDHDICVSQCPNE